MAKHATHEQMRGAIAALLAAEHRIEEALGRYKAAAEGEREVAAALEGARKMAKAHQDALAACLDDRAGAPDHSAAGVEIPLPVIPDSKANGLGVPAVLQAGHALLTSAALSYAALYTLALRLYEPPLRQLAPRHLREYAQAAQGFGELLPGAMAQALEEHTRLACRCICPMCGIGACG